MRVLIAFGSKRGGTEGLARAVGEALAEAGHEVDVRSAQELDDIAAWDAVVVGGALYMTRWYRDARRFVRRHVDELRSMPVWFFSSGPLDDSASEGDIPPPTSQVRKLMKLVGARGHVTFGGRLEADARGFMAQAMVKGGMTGDFRDMEQVRAWARGVADELATLAPPWVTAHGLRGRSLRRGRRALGALCLFTGVTAMGGGVELFGWPEGAPWLGVPVSALEHSPFESFLVPGLLLFALVGMLNLVAGMLVFSRHLWSEVVAFAGGGALAVWIVTEMAMLGTLHWLEWGYLAVGLATMALALWLWRSHAGVWTLAASGHRRHPA